MLGISSLGALAGMGLLAVVVMVVVGVLVAALVLSLAYRMVVGGMPPYARALAVVVLAWLASLVVSFILRLVLPAGMGGLLTLVAQFLIGAAIVDRMLPSASGQIGFGKACVVQLVYLVIFIVLAVLVGLLFGGLLLGH